MSEFTMQCPRCKKIFLEKNIDVSHDVPCYLFKGFNRKDKKQQADKYGRTHLCRSCHEDYEETLRLFLINKSLDFRKKWGDENGTLE